MSAGSLTESDRRPPLAERLAQLFNHDFCPQANRWVYWMKNPIWGLVLATGISAICGYIVNPQCYLITLALAIVIVLGIVWPWIAVRGIDCSISFDQKRVRENEVARVILKVTNRWPWPVWGLTLREGFIGVEGDSPAAGTSLAYVPGWSTAEYVWEFRPSCRGVYPTKAPQMETTFPFGLFTSETSVSSRGNLIVWPRTVPLRQLPDSEDMRLSEDRFTDRRAGDFGDTLGTRPFREGDSLRRVHWVQTARQRSLIVTERQAPATTAVRVIVDTTLANAADGDDRVAQETVLRVAASICESLHKHHAYVEVVLGSTRLTCGQDATAYRLLMDEFASVQFGAAVPSEQTKCRQQPRRGDMLEIFVTATDCGAAHNNLHRRVILVSPERQDGAARVCPWLIVPGDGTWSQRLPRLWKSACHAA